MRTKDSIYEERRRVCELALGEFTEIMRARLNENLHKPGWQGDTFSSLFMRLTEEALELFKCAQGVDTRPSPEQLAKISDEAADVANFAMMISDNAEKILRKEFPHL